MLGVIADRVAARQVGADHDGDAEEPAKLAEA